MAASSRGPTTATSRGGRQVEVERREELAERVRRAAHHRRAGCEAWRRPGSRARGRRGAARAGAGRGPAASCPTASGCRRTPCAGRPAARRRWPSTGSRRSAASEKSSTAERASSSARARWRASPVAVRQLEPAVRDRGVVVEERRDAGVAVAVGAQQPAVGAGHALVEERRRRPGGVEQVVALEPPRALGQRREGEPVPARRSPCRRGPAGAGASRASSIRALIDSRSSGRSPEMRSTVAPSKFPAAVTP